MLEEIPALYGEIWQLCCGGDARDPAVCCSTTAPPRSPMPPGSARKASMLSPLRAPPEHTRTRELSCEDVAHLRGSDRGHIDRDNLVGAWDSSPPR